MIPLHLTLTISILIGFVLTLASSAKYVVTDEAWLEIEIKDFKGPGQDFKGRFTVALFGEDAPMTVLNFASIVRGYKRSGELLTYKNSSVHRIVKDFVIQMGDITVGDGSGGISIFGEKFNDEEFILSHRAPGMVSMANRGTDTNGSQFFITMAKARWMDGKHVVFGKIVKGYDLLQKLNELETDPNTAWPKQQTRIIDCGLNKLQKKYELTDKQMDSTTDIVV